MSGRNPFGNLTGLAALSEISRRLGNVGEQVKDAIIQAQAAADQRSPQTGEQSFTINTANGPIEGKSQVSFRVGSLSDRAPRSGRGASNGSAASRAERKKAPVPDLDGAREPMVDCFEEADWFVVTAELPGVSTGDVKVSMSSNEMVIETTGQRRYRTRQIFTQAVDLASLTYELRNGILEARIRKAS